MLHFHCREVLHFKMHFDIRLNTSSDPHHEVCYLICFRVFCGFLKLSAAWTHTPENTQSACTPNTPHQHTSLSPPLMPPGLLSQSWVLESEGSLEPHQKILSVKSSRQNLWCFSVFQERSFKVKKKKSWGEKEVSEVNVLFPHFIYCKHVLLFPQRLQD